MSHAHGYWFDIKGSGKVNQPIKIQVCFGEIDDYNIRHREKGSELALIGTFKVFIIDEKGVRTDITIKQLSDCWEGTFTPKTKGVYQILAINEELPVVDRSSTGGKNVRPIDYLCAAYKVESNNAVQQPFQVLDILTAKNGKLITIKAYKDKKLVERSTKLRIFNPDNWEKSPEIHENGEAVFMPTMKGLYIIRQDWTDNTSGQYKGVSYSGIRHRCNYCLLVK